MTGPALLVSAGIAIVTGGLWRHRRVVRLPLTSRASTLPLACGLRAVLVGGSLVAAGLGWLYGSPTVVGLACVIGLEELLETSVVIAALRAQDRRARDVRHGTCNTFGGFHEPSRIGFSGQ